MEQRSWSCVGLFPFLRDIVFLQDGKDIFGGQRLSGTSANWSRRGTAMRTEMSGTHLHLIQEEALLTYLGPWERLETFGASLEPL